MLQHLVNIVAFSDISIQHASNEVDTLLAQNIGYSQVTIHDLINTVEWILLVDNGVEENTQCPNVLLCAPIRLASENFRSGVIW